MSLYRRSSSAVFLLIILLSLYNINCSLIHEFSSSDYQESVQDGSTWLVTFYEPWGQSAKFLRTLGKMAPVVDNFKIGKIDCSLYKRFCEQKGIKGFPAIFGIKNEKTIEYTEDSLDIKDIVEFVEKSFPDTPKTTLKQKEKKKTYDEIRREKERQKKIEETSQSGGVIELTEDTLSIVHQGAWMVEFYTQWCDHCKSFAASWQVLAGIAAKKGGAFKVASLDIGLYEDVALKWGIQKVPTIFFINNSKTHHFQGNRSINALQNFAFGILGLNELLVQQEDLPATPPPAEVETGSFSDSSVIVLNRNFDDFIRDKYTFVKFYTPWCGHCKKLAPVWGQLAETHKEYNIAKLDCTIFEDVCMRYEVKGYPTLLLIKPNGEKVKYPGERSMDSLVKFLQENISSS